MEDNRIQEWAKLLLDLGKRNNLINFKDTKKSSIEVVYPDVESIFIKAKGEYFFEVCEPKIDYVNENENHPGLEELSKEDYISKFKTQLTREKDILVYNRVNPILACKEIMKKAKSVIEETGNNISNLSFGFVHWKEDEYSEEIYKAPLLLLPIKIERKSISSPFTIETLGEDVVINPTLAYLLLNQFGITLPEYNEQTLSDYLKEVQTAVKRLGWTVTSECKIGLFSFQKINMFYDLINNKGLIESNEIIKLLLDKINSLNSNENSDHISKIQNPLIELHNVVDADSSQIEAIEMAKSGKSFVLQGPPGTGKSQTITNIIAESLFDGKKVLFVSEKLAALNVVYDKLKKTGLEDFCLELHSHKANKKEFINAINESLNPKRTQVDKKAIHEIAEKEKFINYLDNYESELHKNREVINQSLYSMYDNYSSCKDVAEDNFYAIKNIENKDETYLNNAIDILKQYSDYTNYIGYNYKNNCWYGYIDRDNSFYKQSELKDNLIKIINELKELNSKIIEVNKYNLSINTIEEINVTNDFFGLIYKSEYITPFVLEKNNYILIKEKINKLEIISKRIFELANDIFSKYDEDIISINAQEYEKRLSREFTSVFSRLFNNDYKTIINELRCKNKNGKKEKYNDALNLVKNINEYNNLTKEFEEYEKDVKPNLDSAYYGINTDWNALKKELDTIGELHSSNVDLGSFPNISIDEYRTSKNKYGELYDLVNRFNSNYAKVCEYISDRFNKELFNLYSTDIEYIIMKFEDCVLNIEKLNNWIDFIKLLDEANKIDLIDFIDRSIINNIPSADVPLSYKKTFYHQWIENTIRGNKVLSEFNSVKHNKYVSDFISEDEKHFDINKLQIRSILYGIRPMTDVVPANSPIGVIRHEASKKKKQKSIRSLLSAAGPLIQNLKPCFLMSPLSVSTYIDAKCVEFDTVIFDEASQIFPQDAIGSIYRGKQLIVVGDSKQMPPSNYFNTSIELDDYNDDEDDNSITNYESILDLCSTKFEQKSLRWHYRSKFEDLIAFSNSKFYGGQLITFPSPTIKKEDVGIDYYRVDGVYERNAGVNRKEAEKIVNLVFENARKYPNRSLGVVAFNIKQQSLIEDLIYKRRETDHSCEDFFDGNKSEPFFVKNLETVQGDERDTIIFDVTFAKDISGSFINNFGPLNKVGGERRLNVAVTRAKINLKVIASIGYTDIAITDNLGPKSLRQFLDFAENGTIALSRDIDLNLEDSYDSEFEMEVCEFLRREGFTVDTQVGCSNFRIDMCIRIPDTSNYVLAIECDGATYHSSKNARDRDRLRQQILESMGWKFYRIWSTDWFKNNQNAKEDLLTAARNAVNQKDSRDSTEGTVSSSFEDVRQAFEKTGEGHIYFPKYEICDSVRIRKDSNYINIVKKIMDKEAPISEEWLMKRTLPFFGREKVTSYVVDRYNKIMRYSIPENMIRRNGFLYFKNRKSYTLRLPTDSCRREIEYISLEELASGLYAIIKQNVTVDIDSLYSTMIKLLGFNKITDLQRKRLNKSIKILSGLVSVEKKIVKLVK